MIPLEEMLKAVVPKGYHVEYSADKETFAIRDGNGNELRDHTSDEVVYNTVKGILLMHGIFKDDTPDEWGKYEWLSEETCDCGDAMEGRFSFKNPKPIYCKTCGKPLPPCRDCEDYIFHSSFCDRCPFKEGVES